MGSATLVEKGNTYPTKNQGDKESFFFGYDLTTDELQLEKIAGLVQHDRELAPLAGRWVSGKS